MFDEIIFGQLVSNLGQYLSNSIYQFSTFLTLNKYPNFFYKKKHLSNKNFNLQRIIVWLIDKNLDTRLIDNNPDIKLGKKNPDIRLINKNSNIWLINKKEATTK